MVSNKSKNFTVSSKCIYTVSSKSTLNRVLQSALLFSETNYFQNQHVPKKGFSRATCSRVLVYFVNVLGFLKIRYRRLPIKISSV